MNAVKPLEKERKKQKLSYSELAKMTGIDNSNIRKTLLGIKQPTLCTFYKIAKALGYKQIKLEK